MKKLLAMVLALVMTMSLVTMSNAATLSDMTDAEKVDSTYEVAVGLMTNAGIIAGYPDGSFVPQGTVTRAEMAKMICVSLLGTAQAEKLTASRQIFSDVPVTHWAAAYIEYCYNAGIVGGRGNGIYDPSGAVTGYEAAKMILVAKGYTKTGAYAGTGWQVAVAQDAAKDIFKSSKTASYNNAATREEAAYYIYNGFTTESVVYMSALDTYITLKDSPVAGINPSDYLGGRQYVLGTVNGTTTHDVWGRPTVTYTINNVSGTTADPSFSKKLAPSYTSNVAVSECDVVVGLGKSANVTADLITINGDEQMTALHGGDATFNATNTTGKVGAQGRLLEVYSYKDDTGASKVDVVMLDQFLAKVDSVKEAKYDAAGHVMNYRTLTLHVYETSNAGYDPVTYIDTTNKYASYVKGNMVLLYAETTDGDNVIADNADTNGIIDIEILQVASSVTAAQTAYDLIAKASTIGGTVYKWANQYHLGNHGANSTNYVNYTDTYGNLIGQVVPVDVYSYGVISTIGWVNSYIPLMSSYASANLVFMDASVTSAPVVMDEYMTIPMTGVGVETTGSYSTTSATVSTDVDKNAATYEKKLYQFKVDQYNQYSVTAIGATATAQTIKQGTTNIWGSKYATNDNTIYLVETLDASGKSVYTSYTGYKNVPSMGDVNVSYFLDSNSRYVQYVYVDATAASYTGETVIAVVCDDVVDGASGANNGYYLYVDGTSSMYYVTGGKTLAAVGGTSLGIYEVERNLAGEITAMSAYFSAANVAAGKAKTITSVVDCDGTVLTDVAGNSEEVSETAEFYKVTNNGSSLSVAKKTANDVDGASTAWCVMDKGVIVKCFFVA